MKNTSSIYLAAALTLPALALGGCGSNESDVAGDSHPDNFSLAAKSAAAPGTMQTSDPVTITGISAPTQATISNGTFSVNGGPFSSIPKTVNNGDTIVVQALSSPNYLATSTATLTVGGVSGDYVVTTESKAQQTTAIQSQVKNVVVIYAENRSFDNLYGDFPGANGIPTDSSQYAPQVDRDGTVLAKLPKTWGGVTVSGQDATVTEAQSDDLPNAPFAIETAFQAGSGGQTLSRNTVTRDLYHRFYENQMQIDGGKNDKFAAWGDSGGLVMGHFTTSHSSALYQLAAKNVLADNFFEGAFGGSFLNHQYLICACAPAYPNADDPNGAKPTIAAIDLIDPTKPADFGNYTSNLTVSSTAKASALDAPASFKLSGNIVPKNYFGANDGFRAVNTMQPPYQPSGNAPAKSDATHLYADPTKNNTLPAQTQVTMGDLLTAKNLTWTWYTGAWTQLVQSTTGTTYMPPSSAGTAPVAPNFQFHHQPFNYYTALDPQAHADARAAHLKDYNDLVAQAQSGTLPSVVWYKPEGDVNQHPGYTNVAAGDAHIADLVAKLQASPQYKNMVIVITYDEFGGQWDHVAPPKGDLLGPGTRIPALVISPFAKAGTVDHTQYDTGSTLRLISRVFGTDTLPGLTTRDNALKASGSAPVGDMSAALNL